MATEHPICPRCNERPRTMKYNATYHAYCKECANAYNKERKRAIESGEHAVNHKKAYHDRSS
jgi:tRNA(Ile2) C34 agmatinyltransferase TiaS